jgi:hypothetical protein
VQSPGLVSRRLHCGQLLLQGGGVGSGPVVLLGCGGELVLQGDVGGEAGAQDALAVLLYKGSRIMMDSDWQRITRRPLMVARSEVKCRQG